MPVTPDPLVEALGDVDRVLAGHRVGDEQRLERHRHVAHRRHLVHQGLVDMQAPGGVQQHHVVAAEAGRFHRAAGDLDRPLPGHDRQRRHLGLLAQDLELLLRRRPGHVERGHQHLLVLALLEAHRQLRGRRRLARALQADHQDRARRIGRQDDLFAFAAQRLDQRVVDDLDDHLARRDRLQHLAADGLFLDLGDQIPDHGQRDVGFQQRYPHLAQRRLDVLLLERPAPLQAVEHVSQSAGQAIEHGPSCAVSCANRPVPPACRSGQRETRQCANLADWRSPSGPTGHLLFHKGWPACTPAMGPSQAAAAQVRAG